MDDLTARAIDLLMVGMGTVFSFLALLIFVTMLMSKLVALYTARQALNNPPSTSDDPQSSPSTAIDGQLVAVVTAAVHKYRSRHKK